MEELRPNDQRARYAIAMIWVILFLTIVTLILEVTGLLLTEGIIPLESVPYFVIWLYATGLGYASLLSIIIGIISVVTFIMWFRRAYYNLGLKVGGLLYGNAWSVWAWFIPVVNLYMPFQIMKELYEKTEKYMTFNIEKPYEDNLKTDYVNWWWALWIISAAVNYFSIKIVWRLEEINQAEVNPYTTIIGLGLKIALCVVTIIVIEDYTKAEKVLKEENTEIVSA